MTRDAVLAMLTDRDTVALTIWGEARSLTTGGRVAVALVIAARVRDGRYGKGWKDVCLRRLQFSCWWPQGGAENHRRLMAVAERVVEADPEVWRQDVALRECGEIADAVMVASDATHYLTVGLYRERPPAWTSGKRPIGTCGVHVFFAGVD